MQTKEDGNTRKLRCSRNFHNLNTILPLQVIEHFPLLLGYQVIIESQNDGIIE